MTVTVNEFVEELQQVWEGLNWDRKFEHSTPSDDIIHVWHAYSAEEVADAKQVLEALEEEEENDGVTLIRSAHLGNWSSGVAIVICESEEDSEEVATLWGWNTARTYSDESTLDVLFEDGQPVRVCLSDGNDMPDDKEIQDEIQKAFGVWVHIGEWDAAEEGSAVALLTTEVKSVYLVVAYNSLRYNGNCMTDGKITSIYQLGSQEHGEGSFYDEMLAEWSECSEEGEDICVQTPSVNIPAWCGDCKVTWQLLTREGDRGFEYLEVGLVDQADGGSLSAWHKWYDSGFSDEMPEAG